MKYKYRSFVFTPQGKFGFFPLYQPYEVFLMSDRHKYRAEGRHQDDGNWRAELDQQYWTKKHGQSRGKADLKALCHP